jgi:hypothetical protein
MPPEPVPEIRFELVHRIVVVLTPHDTERYTSAFGPLQGIDAMGEDLYRWIRQIRARGL